MRIQTRLFVGTAALVLALTATQWLLHRRQLAAIERELGVVATAVGKGILEQELEVLIKHQRVAELEAAKAMVWVEDHGTARSVEGIPHGEGSEVAVVTVPRQRAEVELERVEQVLRQRVLAEEAELRQSEVGDGSAADPELGAPDGTEAGAPAVQEQRLELHVTTLGEPGSRFLVLRDGSGPERRIPIPVTPTQRIVRQTANQGLAMGAGLLAVGLAASGLLASRLTRPLRLLAVGAEAVGRGELGVQVREDAAGEVGEVQRAFNRMSSRLETLESERERWLQREHLAQLGDLSRGLAHTVRNPLNTLGLAVEELARERADEETLVSTARAQIRRIDRWLRSFLALAAGDAAAEEVIDLRSLVADVTLQTMQDGARVEPHLGEEEVPVRVVPTALRAAIANLVENGVEASGAEATVLVEVRREGADAVVAVVDRGPGLPEEVRARLFSPHVTTKSDGPGMGLFLARQLIVGMHGGRLEMTDGPTGGTVAEVRLQLCEDDERT